MKVTEESQHFRKMEKLIGLHETKSPLVHKFSRFSSTYLDLSSLYVPKEHHKEKVIVTNSGVGVIQEMIRVGPVGIIGLKDVKWEEKEHSLISHIYVSFSKFDTTEITFDYYETGIVTSVQFGYLENGAIVLSPKYGSSEGHNQAYQKVTKTFTKPDSLSF